MLKTSRAAVAAQRIQDDYLLRVIVSLGGALALLGLASFAHAASVKFSATTENSMPAPFGSSPFPSDLYFDAGQAGDGDGTLLNNASNVGFSAIATNVNFSTVLDRGLDTMTGWGVSTGCHIFFDAALDVPSLPGSPNLTPSTGDSVFLMNLTDGSLVPIKLTPDADITIDNMLSVIPVPGNVLKASTTYACVVTDGVTSAGSPVTATAAFVAARDRTSLNTDANDIYGDAADAVVAFGGGLVRAEIRGMAVFTTQDANDELVAIQTTVLPGLAMPSADFAYNTHDFVFGTPAELDAALGVVPHDSIGVLATGYYEAPRFQTNDPNGNSKTEDLPNLNNLAQPCTNACEPNDERFVDVAPADGLPDVQGTPQVPFTVVIPNTAQPVNGYPIVIDQHGLGGERSLVALLGNALAERGFASIGIEAVAHGYRFHDPNGTNTNNGNLADVASNFPGGTTVPDGFADNGFFGFPLGAISTQLGFFQAFVNLVGARDNFRQTCVDLMSLVRLIQSGTIESGLGGGVAIDENNIFYMGHSLGGIMGSCLAGLEPDVKAYVLNAPGGGLVSQLLVNSSIGAGALESLQTIFGLAPANVLDDGAIFTNVGQMLLDGGDPISKGAHWITDPLVGGPRNLMMVIDHQDEVVPNQAGEALAHAAGLELFSPFVTNPIINAAPFALAGGSGSITANGPSGVTAFLLQQGPAAHAATFFPEITANLAVSNLGFVPGHALVSEWGVDGSGAFPPLDRPIRIANESVLTAVLDWLDDIVNNGAPGTFTFSPAQNPNPRENEQVVAGAQTKVFFDRAVDGVPLADTTADLTVDFASNTAAGRLTASRSTLGTTAVGNNSDMPAGVDILSTGVLPFFVSVQKSPAGTFLADLTITYTAAELADAGIADGSAEEAALQLVRMGGPGTCAHGANVCTDDDDCMPGDVCVELLGGTVDAGNNRVTTTGVSSFSTFAVMKLTDPGEFTPALRINGGGSSKKDCVSGWLVANPAGYVFDSKGNISTKQACDQGNPTCDFDADPTKCTMRVGLCFRLPGIADCPLSSFTGDTLVVEEYSVSKPSEKDVLNPSKPQAGPNRAALLDAVEDVLTLPHTATDSCTTFEILVPLKDGTKTGKEGLKIKSAGLLDDKAVKDSDKLSLSCVP